MSEEQVGPWWAASPSRRDGVGVQPEEERNKSQKKKKTFARRAWAGAARIPDAPRAVGRHFNTL